MYCPHCGKFIEEKNKNKQFKWNILGFFLPFIGFILGMAWEDEKPKEAKSTNIGGNNRSDRHYGIRFCKADCC